MRKTQVLLASFCLLPAVGQPQEAQSSTIIERWACLNARDRLALLFEDGGYDDIPEEKVVVSLTRRSSKDDKSGFGEVSITGITHRARFSVEGLDRRWDFGENGEYAFVINAQGGGAYYDFSDADAGEVVQPSLGFGCISNYERKAERSERTPEVDETPPELPQQDMDNSNLDSTLAVPAQNPNLDVSLDSELGRFSQAAADYLPIVKVAPMYPRRAQSRGLEGYCDLEFTVTPMGTTADVSVIECTSSLFERASVQALLKFKYKPHVVNGTAIAVPGVRHKIMFQMEGTERRRREAELAERMRQEMEGERCRQAIESGELDDYRYPPPEPEASIVKDEAVPIVRIDPQWPREALMDGTEGYVKFRVLIGPDGGVLDVEVTEAAPGRLFVRNALRAVRRWKFKPRIVDGVAVERWATTSIIFELSN